MIMTVLPPVPTAFGVSECPIIVPAVKARKRNARVLVNALPFPFLLAEDVAERAAFLVAIPFAGGAKLVENATRDEGGGGDLGVGMRPFLASQRAAILERGDIFESRITLQVGDARRIGVEHAKNVFIRQTGKSGGVIGRFDDDFVSAERF